MKKPARTRRPNRTTPAADASGMPEDKKELAAACALRLSDGLKQEPAKIHCQIWIEEDLLAWLRAKNKHWGREANRILREIMMMERAAQAAAAPKEEDLAVSAVPEAISATPAVSAPQAVADVPADSVAERMRALTARFVETLLLAELKRHLALSMEPNKRNGFSRKSLRTPYGPVPIKLPRDRLGTFRPVIIGKRRKGMFALDDALERLYCGTPDEDAVVRFVRSLYAEDVSEDFVEEAAKSVLDDVEAWRKTEGREGPEEG